MAKTSGLGAKITLADSGGTPRTISNDITDFTLNTPINLQDITGVDKSAHERLALLIDLTAQLKFVFNAAANMSHAVLSSATTSPNVRALAVFPTSNGSSPTLPANVLIGSYNITRSNAGELTGQSDLSLADGSIPTWSLCPSHDDHLRFSIRYPSHVRDDDLEVPPCAAQHRASSRSSHAATLTRGARSAGRIKLRRNGRQSLRARCTKSRAGIAADATTA